jgi:hydroxymethylbilane synthase
VTVQLRFATRGSQLALWQTHAVADALREGDANLAVQIQTVQSTGDRLLDVPLAQIGDRGLFTKELDAALLEGSADIAVHSLKDIPTRLPAGLVLAAVTRREDPRDALVCRPGYEQTLATLPAGARVGTSSLRRAAQLRAARPDLEVADLRGNLNTRVAKLDAGAYDAIILAAAGLVRLGWSHRIQERLDAAAWLPAVGQGALGVVIREDCPDVGERLLQVHDSETAACVTAERAFLNSLEGGCQVPIGALGRAQQGRLTLDGFVSGLGGAPMLRGAVEGRLTEASSLGRGLGRSLIDRGAAEVLTEVRQSARALLPESAVP